MIHKKLSFQLCDYPKKTVSATGLFIGDLRGSKMGSHKFVYACPESPRISL